MALVTEDGTGKADAESLISVADADTYHSARGNTAWAALETADKEAALRKATDYMGATYALRWSGWRASDTQALDWPRYEVPRLDRRRVTAYWPSDEVPVLVARACADLALRATTDDLAPDLTQAVKRQRVEGAVEIEYQDYSIAAPRYPAIENTLSQFLAAGSGNRLVRG